MKKGILTVLAAIAAASLPFVYAQTETNQPPPMPPGQHWQEHWQQKFDRMSQQLNLTEQQKTNVQAIFDEFRQKMGEAKTNADTQLQSVLTPEQYQKLQSRMMHRHGWRGHHGGDEGDEGEEGGTNTDTNANSGATQ